LLDLKLHCLRPINLYSIHVWEHQTLLARCQEGELRSAWVPGGNPDWLRCRDRWPHHTAGIASRRRSMSSLPHPPTGWSPSDPDSVGSSSVDLPGLDTARGVSLPDRRWPPSIE